MFHLAAYFKSIPNGTVLVEVTQLSDAIIAASNNGFLIPANLPQLAFVAGVGTSLTRIQLTSGSIRKMFPWDIEPVNVVAAIESPARFLDLTDAPFVLDVGEELDAYAVQSAAAAENAYVFVCFSDGPLRPVGGRIQTIHSTSSTTLTANAWTACTLTLDNGLDGGTYAIVGARGFSAGALAFRFVPRGSGVSTRPGGFAVQARDSLTPQRQRNGGWGEWLRFANTAVPQVEFLSVSADTAEEVYLDLIKVG
jgi:hypothetical protein